MDFGISNASSESCVETVRALHQTIIALRTALEKSRSEISELKAQNWCIDNTIGDTIRNLSIENHVLRQKAVNTEADDLESTKKESKQKRVKRKDSKEKICAKKEQSGAEFDRIVLSEKNKLKNTYRSLENVSSTKVLSKSDKNQRQLTKSKTVYFSNIFEGENQISTTNSLHIGALKKDKLKTSTEFKDRRTKSKSKEKKPNKSLNFREEPVKDNFIASRRGSITDFETEKHISSPKERRQVKEYSEYIKKSELHKVKGKSVNNQKTTVEHLETSELVKGNLIDKKRLKKREETFVKEPSEELLNDQKNNVIRTRETRRKSSILGEEIEKALTEQYPAKDKLPTDINVKDIEEFDILKKEDKLNNISSDLLVKSTKRDGGNENEQLKVTNIKLGQLQLNKLSGFADETIPKTIENLVTGESGAKTKDSENLLSINKEKIVSTGCELDGDVGETIEKVEIAEGNASGQEQLEIFERTDQSTKETIEDHLKRDKIKDDTETNEDHDRNSSETTVNSSEPSTNSSTSQKNVEISVKIYKGSKQPIEIDIQTKKKPHKSKKSDKHTKMNNKSQNTSFDKDYGDSPANQAGTNEVRRHVESATVNNIVTNILQNDVEQEVDDIELIFTTDDTKDTDFKEELVPIDTYGETQLLQCPLSDYEEKLSAEASDRELEDDVFNDNFENENQENCNFQTQTYDFRRENSQIYNSKSDNSINHEDKSLKSYYSYQDSSFENKSLEKDESFDRFEEKTRIIETDISKIGIQDVEYNTGRRNTCPNPIQYRPIMHREALGRGLSSSRKCRPILAHSNVVRKESGAQTDISALPGSSWRSESSLGHKVKVGENFTTLPSKFPHPGSRLRLSEKTVEARRVLLSDIGFTSMVPELSRSADHLCPPAVRGPVVSSYGQFLRTTDLYSPAYTSQKFVWTTTTPSEGSHSQSRYSSQYPLSSPPVPTRRCSAPVSPSKKAAVLKSTPSKVRFANGSLPELRGDWTATVDSGESTDSLVEEAEHFLRRSIDCLAPCKDICFRSENVKMSGVRRASAPEPTRDNVPPQGWQPFLPRIPRDLHLDYWVKVISPEGRVRGGRVRYVGPLLNQMEAFVGVQLSTPDGHSDGTYNSRRYFNCEPYHGLFVPFKKIIMGWRP